MVGDSESGWFFPMMIFLRFFRAGKLLALAGALGILFLWPGMVGADAYSRVEEVYTWSAPRDGTPVAHYTVQILINDIDIEVIEPVFSEQVSVEMEYGNKYRVRVAGVDAAGTKGPYSIWSMPFTPELEPPGF